MKRDMDLVRAILLHMEELPNAFPASVEIEGYSQTDIAYHQHLIIQAGLAMGAETTNLKSIAPEARIQSLTWAGHEFLDASRDPSIWEQAKNKAGKVGGVSLQIMTTILTELIKEKLGLS